MSQNSFSIHQFLIGLLRLSSSNQTLSDHDIISRFICQITGFEFRYVAPSDSPSSEDHTLGDGSVSRQEKSTQHHPGSSISTPLAQPTTTNMGGASTKQSYSTTEIVEDKSTQQEDSSNVSL